MVSLIGGITVDGTLRRDVALKPLTGAAELVLAELHQADISHPEKVTRFLSETIQSIGGSPVDPAVLSVGDRQHLVREIGVQLGVDLIWLAGECTDCGESLEIPVRQAELPTKAAGKGFPNAQVDVDGIAIRVRAPTGKDQAAISQFDAQAASLALLKRLIVVPEGAALSSRQHQTLEQAIEDLSPEVAQEVAATCPECGADLRIEVDPYLSMTQLGAEIIDDIHVLARTYHWSEQDILALPKVRRQTYLARIEQDRGMTRQVDPAMAY